MLSSKIALEVSINSCDIIVRVENEMGEKVNEDVGSGKAIPSSVDNIQTDYPENQLEVSSGLTTSPAAEKKKRQKKSSKDHINKSTASTTTPKTILNEREKVSGNIDLVNATSESIPNSGGEKLADTLVDAIQNGKFDSWSNIVLYYQMSLESFY